MSLAEIHKSGDYLTHEKLWIASLKSGQFAYRSGYFLNTPGRWRGFEWKSILDDPSLHQTLVIGHSDNTVSEYIVRAIMATSSITRIFASNLDPKALNIPGVVDLPLGIPNDEKQSRTHIIQSDAGLLRRAWRQSQPPDLASEPVLYANFSIRNNPPERTAAWKATKAVQGARLGTFELSKRGRFKDLVAMRTSGLVVCPPGGGMDTHRFWEALLMGAVPVATEGDHSARVARSLGLPVITVSAWSDLGRQEHLREEWRGIAGTTWDVSPLTSEFWITRLSCQQP